MDININPSFGSIFAAVRCGGDDFGLIGQDNPINIHQRTNADLGTDNVQLPQQIPVVMRITVIKIIQRSVAIQDIITRRNKAMDFFVQRFIKTPSPGAQLAILHCWFIHKKRQSAKRTYIRAKQRLKIFSSKKTADKRAARYSNW